MGERLLQCRQFALKLSESLTETSHLFVCDFVCFRKLIHTQNLLLQHITVRARDGDVGRCCDGVFRRLSSREGANFQQKIMRPRRSNAPQRRERRTCHPLTAASEGPHRLSSFMKSGYIKPLYPQNIPRKGPFSDFLTLQARALILRFTYVDYPSKEVAFVADLLLLPDAASERLFSYICPSRRGLRAEADCSLTTEE